MEKRHVGSVVLFAAVRSWFASLLACLAVSLFAWSFRDGLGPDSVESYGSLAFNRFWASAWWQLSLAVAIFLLGCLLYQWDVHQSATRRSHVLSVKPAHKREARP
jgi:hypothetical protein